MKKKREEETVKNGKDYKKKCSKKLGLAEPHLLYALNKSKFK